MLTFANTPDLSPFAFEGNARPTRVQGSALRIGLTSRRLLSIAWMAAIALFNPPVARAQTVDLDTLGTHWQATLGGAAATIVAHEFGHLLVGATEDAEPYFDGLSIKYRHYDGTDRQGLRLSSAGFQAQWLVSEYAFHRLHSSPGEPGSRAWNAGLILGHLGITAAYLTFLRDHEDGDVTGIVSATGLSTAEVLTLISLPAVLDGWRLFGNDTPRWAGWVAPGMKGLGITAIWTF